MNEVVEKIKTGISTKPEPTVEDIRNKASEIYYQRIERGEYGTAEKDWAEAEKYLQEERSGRERP